MDKINRRCPSVTVADNCSTIAKRAHPSFVHSPCFIRYFIDSIQGFFEGFATPLTRNELRFARGVTSAILCAQQES